MSDEVLIFRHVRIVLPNRVTDECDLVIKAGRIALWRVDAPHPSGATVIEGRGRLVVPGLVDLHCHSDGVRSFFEDPNRVARNLLRAGTTSVLATLAYCDMIRGQLRRQVVDFWQARRGSAIQVIRGVHLEGPYTNPKYGALVRPGQVHRPDPAEYGPVLKLEAGVVRLWTLAPELPGAVRFARAAAAKGIVLAAGHCEASIAQLEALLPLSLKVATHWSNASGAPPARFAGTRSPGIDEFALINDRMVAEVICDRRGLHVSPTMLRLLYRSKGPDGIVLISDAYWSEVAPRRRVARDVHFTADGQLNGSNLTMLDAARNFRRTIRCGLPELFRMGALNPAKLLGWEASIGSLEPGKLANLLLVDDALKLHGVWLEGRRVRLR